MVDAPRHDSPESDHAAERHGEVTDLLHALGEGDNRAVAQLAPLVYDELHEIAHRQIADERPGHTLQTTGLVHEAFLKLLDLNRIQLRDRSHFYALSARLMRQILTDYAKRRRALKRGGARDPVPIDEGRDAPSFAVGDTNLDQLIELDEALSRLAEISPRQPRIVECRFFADMSVEETAEALDISPATVKRDWQLARAWLNRELS